MNLFKRNIIISLVLLLGSTFLLATPVLNGIENALPGEKHPYAFEEYRSVFNSKENPLVKRLIALNDGMKYSENIPHKATSSLHKLNYQGKNYLFKDVFRGSRSMPISRKINEIVGLPHVMNIYGMKSVQYDEGGVHFVQLMEFLPGKTLEKEEEQLKLTCPANLETKLLNIVSQLHDSIIELNSKDIYCGDEKPRNYVFDRETLKRVDIEADCRSLEGQKAKFDLGWLSWAKKILQHCNQNTTKIELIINGAKGMDSYNDLNSLISRNI